MVGGIDLGGTKIEAALFNTALDREHTRNRPTPKGDYDALLNALIEEIEWLTELAGDRSLPVGIGMPGLVDPQTGLSFTANIPASGKPLARDLEASVQGPVAIANDCKCFALSEAVGGAGHDYERVFGLILGTGVGGGLCVDKELVLGANGIVGEVGHYSLPAHLVERYNLPLLPCNCGRTGCNEAYLSGPGMSRLAQLLCGAESQPQEIARDPALADAFTCWLDLATELLFVVHLHLDPQCIVLGGGLSNIDGIDRLLADRLAERTLPDTRPPPVFKPVFGASSGTRGAALLALHQRR
jgi:predicted NBD/HSP70 family sugar kinase